MSTILRLRGGSHAYGLNTPQSDEDFIEVFIEPPHKVFGPGDPDAKPKSTHSGPNPAAANYGAEDTTRYPLRKFLFLAAQGNPTVLESLYSPVIYHTEPGYELLNMRGAFISREMIPRYRGYMRAQTLRLLGLKGGHSAGKENRKTETSERVGYDTKYAMHVLRLGYYCYEFATTGYLVLPMVEDDPHARKSFLLSVRAGEVNFRTFFEEALKIDELLGELLTAKSPFVQYKLPAAPDHIVITNFSVRVHMAEYNRYMEEHT